MLACAQDYPVDGVLVETQQACSCPHTDAFGCVVDDLSNRFGRQMHTEKRAGTGGGKTLAAGATVQQLAAFVLAILAANGDVVPTPQAVIFALFVGTKALLKFAHGLPPAWSMNCTWTSLP